MPLRTLSPPDGPGALANMILLGSLLCSDSSDWACWDSAYRVVSQAILAGNLPGLSWPDADTVVAFISRQIRLLREGREPILLALWYGDYWDTL